MTTSPLFKRVLTRAELESEDRPREFLLDDPKERRRLFFECRGFLHTCHFKHGTDWEGRRFAIEALDKLAASPEPPAEEGETLRERVKELEAGIEALQQVWLSGAKIDGEKLNMECASLFILLDRARAKGGE